MAPKDGWFVYALVALIFWGLWGFFPKIAGFYIDPVSILIYEIAGTIAVGLVIILLGFRPEISNTGAILGVLTGITLTLGSLFFLFALSKGKASVVVTMTALYPLITIILAVVILREQITLRQGIGMLLAFTAMILFSY